MPPPRAVIRFVVFAVLFYSPMAFPARLWPAWERAYARVFRTCGNVFFSQFWLWPEARVRFLDLRSPRLVQEINAAMPGRLPPGFVPPRPTPTQDTLLVLLNRKTPGSIGMLRTGSHVMGYVPLTVLVALILATPIRWSRRGWALLWGLVLVHGFLAVRLTALVVNNGFAAPGKQYALFHPGPFWKGALARADEVLADNPTFAYVSPVCLWLLILIVFAFWARWRNLRTNASRVRPGERSDPPKRGPPHNA